MRVFRLTEDGRPRVTEARRYLLLEAATIYPRPIRAIGAASGVAAASGVPTVPAVGSAGGTSAAAASGAPDGVGSATGTSTAIGRSATEEGLFGNLMNPTPTQAGTGLSWLRQDGASVADTEVGITITRANAGANDNCALMSFSAPATPYKYRALLALTVGFNGSGIFSTLFGWYASGSTKMHVIRVVYNNDVKQFYVSLYDNPTTFTSGGNLAGPYNFMAGNPLAVEIEDDSTNVYFRISADGDNFEQVYSVAKASGHLGATGYDTIVFGVAANGAEAKGTLMGLKNV